MSLIKIQNLTFSYYGYNNDIFKDVALNIDTTWKTGLIGRNGIGKSTLFKILLNEVEYTGSVSKNVNFIKFPPKVPDYSLYGIELFSILSGSSEEWRLFKELNLLNMNPELLYVPFGQLSKGEQTKVLLAVLFTIENGFLLIDEPTNHLDYHGREIVGEYLRNKEGFILISHDRNFLDNCIDHVISINRNSIDIQSGNFTSWYINKQRRDSFEIEENKKLRKDIKRLQDSARQSENWSNKVEKTKNGVRFSGSKPDKGYIGHKSAKMMQKSKNLEKRRNKAVEEKKKLLKDLEVKEDLKLQFEDYKKNTLMSIENLSAFYEDRKIIDNISFTVNKGDRIAICGGNGSGKSTLLKLLMGEKIKYSGFIGCQDDLKISYIAQDTSDLKGKLDDYIRYNEADETLCKTILRKLDFSRELFELEMESYSDGQKKKVLIALSLAKKANIFIWDEPLNYIDIISRMQIEEIILNEKPVIVFVEHDKKFTEKIANKIIEL